MQGFARPLRTALLPLIEAADGLERSWSISTSGPKLGQVEERFLLFFDQLDARNAMIAEVALDLGMTRDLVDRWQSRFTGADAMGIAVNTAGSSVRLYLQYWDQVVDRVEAGDLSPQMLYLGLKSMPQGHIREDVYTCHPIAPRSEFMPQLSLALSRIGIADLGDVFDPLDADACIFTTTEAAGRMSFLTTVRRANLDRARVAGLMADLPSAPWTRALQDHAQQADLLHIAGGQDALKGDFTTLYFTCTAQDIP